jgi:hypothetical protein
MTYQGSWHVGPYPVYPVLGGIPLMAQPLIDWLQMGKRHHKKGKIIGRDLT